MIVSIILTGICITCTILIFYRLAIYKQKFAQMNRIKRLFIQLDNLAMIFHALVIEGAIDPNQAIDILEKIKFQIPDVDTLMRTKRPLEAEYWIDEDVLKILKDSLYAFDSNKH